MHSVVFLPICTDLLQSFSTLKEVETVAVRRSLCYPLYRHWDLSMKVLDDVKSILQLGKY